MRIGIDVGGTNTDAVLINNREVLYKAKNLDLVFDKGFVCLFFKAANHQQFSAFGRTSRIISTA